jgi:hypothetical protein
VKAAVNLDARGTSGPSLMFETGSANSWLMRLYATAIAHPITNSLYYVVYKQLQNEVTDISVATAAGPQRSKLIRLPSGATLLDVVGLGAAGVEFSVDVAGSLPVMAQVFDQSYEFAGDWTCKGCVRPMRPARRMAT